MGDTVTMTFRFINQTDECCKKQSMKYMRARKEIKFQCQDQWKFSVKMDLLMEFLLHSLESRIFVGHQLPINALDNNCVAFISIFISLFFMSFYCISFVKWQ